MSVNVRAWPIGLLGFGATAGVAVLGYAFISWGSFRGDCSDGASRFAYSVYGKGIRSTDVAVFSEGREMRVTADGQSGDPSFSPDGSRVVYSTGRLGTWDPEYGSGENGFERRALFTTRVTEASRTQGSNSGDQLTRGPFDTEPDWSPDGSKVVFVREPRYGEGDDELWVVNLETKEELLLLHLPTRPRQDNQFRSPAWSPDGRRIAFLRSRDERGRSMNLWLMDGDGSNARPLAAEARTGGDLTWSGDVSWSPEGEALVFDGSTDNGGWVHVFDLEENRTRPLAEGSWPAWAPDGSRIAYFVDTLAGSEAGWMLTAIDPRGDKESRVEGARPVAFYAYQELDWACG